MTQYVFYFLSFVALLCAIMVIVSRNPIHSALYLVLTFFAISAHYILMNAQFLFIVNVIVYAGAIMVLFLHVIMLVNLKNERKKISLMKFAGVIAGGLLFVTLVGSLKSMGMNEPLEAKVSDIGLVKNLGKHLFDKFLLPFEISAVLFLSAMIGAVLLGKKEKASPTETELTLEKKAQATEKV